MSGLYRAAVSIHDQYIREAGQFVPIEEDFEADGADGYALKARARLRHQFRLADNGSRQWFPRTGVTGEFVTLGRPAGWNGSAWQTPNIGPPVRVGNKLTWSTANWGMVITLGWRTVKLDMIVKATNVSKVRWPVTLTGITRQGARLIGGDGSTVARLEVPIAWDATGSRQTPNVPITWNIIAGTVEFSWNPVGVVYPVTIDPTFTSQPDATAGKDTDFYSLVPSTTDGTSTDFRIGWFLAGNGANHALIQFDVSSIPATATINSATMEWVVVAGFGATFTIELYRSKRAWVENEACWNDYSSGNNWATAGGTGANDKDASTIGTLASPFSGTETITLDATLVQEWVSGAFANNGMICKAAVESGNNLDLENFGSSDNDTAGNRPKLVIVYTEAAAARTRSLLGVGT